MGQVYRAKDTRLDREVAVKILPPELARNEAFRSRFEREAKVISALSHPHICALYDVGTAAVDGADVHYLVLELLDGESVAKRVARGPMPIEQVLRYGVEITAALDVAR
jgi:serine/threonine protein kinase